MKKLSISILVCLLAVTSVFGLMGMKSAVSAAEVQIEATEGFYLIGAGLKKTDSYEDDVAGIEFQNVLTKKAYDAILEEAGDKQVKFGITVTNKDGTDPEDICYVSNVSNDGKENFVVPTFASEADNEEFRFRAAITFKEETFKADLETYLGVDEVDDNTLKAYLSAAYGTLLYARSYYEIDGVKKYVDEIARSMSMLANYHKVVGDITDQEWIDFYQRKNYFTIGESISGTFFEEETGKIFVNGLTLNDSDKIAYKAENISYAQDANGIVLSGYEGIFSKDTLGQNIDFYVFDEDNKVTTITVKHVTKLISTAQDILDFSVGYTFDETYLATLEGDARTKYLEKCQDSPFDYYDGYYVQTNNISMSGQRYSHPAVIRVSPTTVAGFRKDETENKLVPVHANALFEGYAIPREGYPLLSDWYDSSNPETSSWYRTQYGESQTINFKKIGFMGTYDGQGYVIDGVYTDVYDSSTFRSSYYVGETLNTSNYGAGVFGIISYGATIKNVAFTNIRGNYNSAGLAMSINASRDLDEDDMKVYTNTNRPVFENIYISGSSNGSMVNVLYYAENRVKPQIKNVVINITNNGGYGVVSPSTYAEGDGRYGIGGPLYIVGGSTTHTGDAVDALKWIKEVSTLAELYANTDILTRFEGNEYWVKAGNAVYFKGVYNNNKDTIDAGISLVDGNGETVDSLTFDSEITAYTVQMKDAYGVVNAEVSIPENVGLSYVDGQIVLDNETKVFGDYLVTFTAGAVTKTLAVSIPIPTNDKGYLQENGEWVESGIINIEGLTFKVDGIDATASFVNNKLMLDWEGSLATSLGNKVSIVVYENGKQIAQYNSMYVTLAIDEASELNFSVGYTFDEEYFTTLSGEAKTEYLEYCAANPFDYYDGYYVLVKDIDMTGVEFVHDALGLFTEYKNGVGYKPDEANNVFTVANGAPDVEGYRFPRKGYPMMFDVPYDYPYNTSYPQTVKFVKIGFMGTFDGQGHIVSNVNTQLSAENYKTYTLASGAAKQETTGAGIFGTINYGAVIKNVAFTNLYVNNSAGLALHNNMNGALDATADSVAYPNANKALIEDVYIQVSNTSVTPRGIIYNAMASTYNAQIRNVVVVANGVANIGEQHAVLNFLAYNEGYGGGIGDGTNGRLYLVVDTTQHTTGGAATRGILKQVTSLNDLFTTTDAITTLANREYWETVMVGDVTGVFFKGTYGATWKVVDGSSNEINSITLTEGASSVAVSVKDILGNTITPNVTFDTDTLDYVDGAIVIKQGMATAGEYVATFTSGDNSKSIKVIVDDSFTIHNSEGTEIDSITLSEYNTSFAVNAKDIYGNAITPSVTFNTEILDYVDGAIVVKDQYVVGNYTATFTSGSKSKTLSVELEFIRRDLGYIQENGEWIDSGITKVDGKTFKVNGEDAQAQIVEGKLMLTLPTMTTALGSDATIEVFENEVKQVEYSSMYVTKTISTAQDILDFSVGYKFDETEFNNITSEQEKVKYLEDCEKDPFDYYEGYYVMTNNISMAGQRYSHPAVIRLAPSTVAGFKKDETNNVLLPVHANAIYPFDRDGDGEIGTYDWDGDGNITAAEKEGYAIPREGYPLLSDVYGAGTADEGYFAGQFGYHQTINFKKIGFMGTFDGQGYVIDGVYTDVYDSSAFRSSYFVGDSVTPNTSNYGAGVFGIISFGATIKNVAFTNMRGNYNSAGLALSINSATGLDATDLTVYTNSSRPVFENIYISGSPHGSLVNALWYADSRSLRPLVRNVVVDVTANTGYGVVPPGAYTEGSYNGGVVGPLYVIGYTKTGDAVSVGYIRTYNTLAEFYTASSANFAENNAWTVVDSDGDGVNEVYFKALAPQS